MLLLDTHVVVWWLEGNRKLGASARRVIGGDGAVVWVSAASVWEIAIKVAAGGLRLRDAPAEVLSEDALSRAGFQPLHMRAGHALAAGVLPAHHHDPFDRMLIAQAQLEGLTIVTSDTAFEDYDVTLLDARA